MNLEKIDNELKKLINNLTLTLDTLQYIISLLMKNCKIYRVITELSILANIILSIILFLGYYSKL